MPARVFEANFDGLVGPTHNYSGLAAGNKAAEGSTMSPSNPREAALQGLEKMKFLLDLGLVQGVLPPQERPDVAFLWRLGFRGSDAEVVQQAFRESQFLLSSACSAAAMWAANAATVTPSVDAEDGKVHFTPANLVANLHRSLEAPTTQRVLRRIFPEGESFAHHPPLPSMADLSDEGAANHLRLCRAHAYSGTHLLVYGCCALAPTQPRPKLNPARQTREACAALARLHHLPPKRVVLAQQSPQAIDEGVFHNDVIALSNESLLVVHEEAYVDTRAVLKQLQDDLRCHDTELDIMAVSAAELPLADAVKSYFFNSQLITTPEGGMCLLLPKECDEVPAARAVADRLKAERKIFRIQSFDLRQSMRNGGGPACLRLRVVLTDEELAKLEGRCLLNQPLYEQLVAWVNRHYRERLVPSKDLADPALLRESRQALDELTSILSLGSIYRFQGAGG